MITDWDPLDGANPPLGVKRALDIDHSIKLAQNIPPFTPAERATWEAYGPETFRAGAAGAGVFLNEQTFEVSIATTPALLRPLLDTLDAQGFGAIRTRRLAAWRADPTTVDYDQLLAMVADIGKGRLAGKLASRLAGLQPPQYISQALQYVVRRIKP